MNALFHRAARKPRLAPAVLAAGLVFTAPASAADPGNSITVLRFKTKGASS